MALPAPSAGNPGMGNQSRVRVFGDGLPSRSAPRAGGRQGARNDVPARRRGGKRGGDAGHVERWGEANVQEAQENPRANNDSSHDPPGRKIALSANFAEG